VDAPLPGLGYRALQVRIAPHEVPSAAHPAGGVRREPARSAQEWGVDPSRAADALEISTERLENRFFRLTLDARGVWSSLLDKRYDRQVLAAEGGGNALVAFEDKPVEFDAWDINSYYVDKAWPIDDVSELRVVETGPLRGGIEIVRRYQASTIRQRILLHARLPRIDVVTQIDWHERQTLVKAAFPLAVRSSRATYECAFGHVERPTHRNTSWDAARFEVPAHRWADLSEAGYGVSLLNDGKYGHDCLGHVLRLTLLKSAIEPDPLADEGEHRFTYALWPHGPGWSVEETVRQAYALNLPPRAVLLPASAAPGSGAAPAAAPTSPVGGSSLLVPRREEGLVAALVTCDRPQVVLDTVKTAEDGDGLIVRLYDCAGSRGPATLTFAGPVERAAFCNLLEEPLAGEGPACEGHTLRLYVEPFQVRTLRVNLGPLDL
jgi:alpha-mannosidase